MGFLEVETMAKAKTDFTANAKQTVAEQITEATASIAQDVKKGRRVYDAQETLAAQEARSTQGKKGMYAPRINLAFTPSIYEYIKTMAAVKGQSMTEFVNEVLQQSLEDNKDIYEQAKVFKTQFK